MRYNIKDYHKGKCKCCGEKKMVYFGMCQECHGRVMKESQRKGREKNPFVG